MQKSEFIKWCNSEEAAKLADITRANYRDPQAIGTIDGIHLHIILPADGFADL